MTEDQGEAGAHSDTFNDRKHGKGGGDHLCARPGSLSRRGGKGLTMLVAHDHPSGGGGGG